MRNVHSVRSDACEPFLHRRIRIRDRSLVQACVRKEDVRSVRKPEVDLAVLVGVDFGSFAESVEIFHPNQFVGLLRLDRDAPNALRAVGRRRLDAFVRCRTMRRVDGRAFYRERVELLGVIAVAAKAYVVRFLASRHRTSARGHNRSARYVDHRTLGIPIAGPDARGACAADRSDLSAGYRNLGRIAVLERVAISVADSRRVFSAVRRHLAAGDGHFMSVRPISAADSRTILISIRLDLAARNDYRSARMPVPAAETRGIPSTCCLDLAAGDFHNSLLRHFGCHQTIVERSAADTCGTRVADSIDDAAGNFDRSVALEVSAADSGSLICASCRQDRRGRDVIVVRDDSHYVHIVRHDDDTAVPVLHLIYVLYRVRVVLDVIKVGDGHVGVDVRYDERRRVGHVNRGDR